MSISNFFLQIKERKSARQILFYPADSLHNFSKFTPILSPKCHQMAYYHHEISVQTLDFPIFYLSSDFIVGISNNAFPYNSILLHITPNTLKTVVSFITYHSILNYKFAVVLQQFYEIRSKTAVISKLSPNNEGHLYTTFITPSKS